MYEAVEQQVDISKECNHRGNHLRDSERVLQIEAHMHCSLQSTRGISWLEAHMHAARACTRARAHEILWSACSKLGAAIACSDVCHFNPAARAKI